MKCGSFIFDSAAFLDMFPEFAETDPSKISSCGRAAHLYISMPVANWPMEDFEHRQYALFLLAAHILALRNGGSTGDAGAGETGGSIGRVKKATVGSVTVETDSPNGYTSTDFSYWLGQTQYGLELLAYLDTMVPLGVFSNGPHDTIRILQ